MVWLRAMAMAFIWVRFRVVLGLGPVLGLWLGSGKG
jgi:hypothetical protein